MQKLSALSSSLARVVSDEEEEAKLDQFPTEEVREVTIYAICCKCFKNKYLSKKTSKQLVMTLLVWGQR